MPDAASGTIGVYCCGDESCDGIHYIRPDRMRQWRPDLGALAGLVAANLDATSGEEIVPGRLILLGSATRGGVYRELFLARGLWWEDAALVVSQAGRFRSSPAPALLAVSRLPDPELWRPGTPAVLSLEELIQVKRERVVVDLAPAFGQKVQALPDYSRWLTVTQAAHLLVKDLSCDDLAKAKARVSTAANRGTIRTNGGKGEHRLLDPESVNAWRLVQRDKVSDAADADEPVPSAPRRRAYYADLD